MLTFQQTLIALLVQNYSHIINQDIWSIIHVFFIITIFSINNFQSFIL